jgi:hypothetical protein
MKAVTDKSTRDGHEKQTEVYDVRFSFARNNTHRSATFLCGHDILFTDDTEVEDMIPGFARTLDETIRRESSGN